MKPWNYDYLKTILKDEPLPAMVVDLGALNKNIEYFSTAAKKHGKKIRVASKSVRVPFLLRHMLEQGKETFQGLMCFSVSEAAYLAKEGFSDLLVAYPSTHSSDLKQACEASTDSKICLCSQQSRPCTP